MMNPEEYQKIIFAYISVRCRAEVKSIEDMLNVKSELLLDILNNSEEPIVIALISIMKSSNEGRWFFDKLMGDHEIENKPAVEKFFNIYQKIVMGSDSQNQRINPLIIYMPKEQLDDFTFVQSRETFFMNQKIEIINEYLLHIFDTAPEFQFGEQDTAWKYFLSELFKGGGY